MRLVLKEVEGWSEEDVCWHNMRLSDFVHSVELFQASALGWLKLNPTKNYQHLEELLRKKALKTHLIAVKYDDPGLVYGLYQNGVCQKMGYACLFSCRPIEGALKELHTHWSSYEENFTHLSQTGNLFLGKLPADNTSGSKKEPFYSLRENRKIISLSLL